MNELDPSHRDGILEVLLGRLPARLLGGFERKHGQSLLGDHLAGGVSFCRRRMQSSDLSAVDVE